jgi:hypothetical protein
VWWTGTGGGHGDWAGVLVWYSACGCGAGRCRRGTIELSSLFFGLLTTSFVNYHLGRYLGRLGASGDLKRINNISERL